MGGILIWFLVPVDFWSILVWVVVLALGAVVSRISEKEFGHDARPIVIDEILGMGVSLLFVPKQLAFYVAAFVLFRLFDIVKPFPARQAERLPLGWGVMADDLVAGVYVNIVMQIFLAVRTQV